MDVDEMFEPNKIYLGDCVQLLSNFTEHLFEMTLTDIPYAIVNRKSNGLRNLDKGNADIATFDLQNFLHQINRVTRGSIYIFCSTEQVSEIRQSMVSFGLSTRLCIWQKTNPSPMNGQYLWLSGIECCVFGRRKGAVFNEKCKNPVWLYPVERRRGHHTPKPLKLFEYLIRTSSNEGDLVLDPCIGSGTTALACIKNNRKFIGIDIDEQSVELANSALESLDYV